jgi:2-polyprenyl-3-methyl-5-hydroxy-6-metoxy-1,4-benzoquinol methylase
VGITKNRFFKSCRCIFPIFKVAGLDASPSARQQVADRFASRGGFLGSFKQSEINGSGLQFDAIIAAEVIEHLYDEQLDSLLKTLTTLSTPETRIIFTTPNEEKLEDSYIMCPVSGQLFHRWQHVRNWSQASVKSYLDSRNFTVITSLTTDFDASFITRGKKHPLRLWWHSLQFRLKYLARPDKKRPHMVVIAQPDPANT